MKTLALLLFFATSLPAQVISQPWMYKNVRFDGNSLAHFQYGITGQELPLLRNVTVLGWNGETCSMVLSGIGASTPATTDLMMLFDSTNDVGNQISVAEHMACMYQTINVLLARNPNMKILIANTPPWTEDPGSPSCQDGRGQWTLDLIAAYNAAYAGSPGSGYNGFQSDYPHNVRVVDVWTPNTLSSGWAIPSHFIGPCGKHPGNPSEWETPGDGNEGWPLFTPTTTAAIYSALQQVW